MNYRDSFDATVREVIQRTPRAVDADFWPEALTEEGVEYGQAERLAADEAATWYLSAAALVRMQEGALGAPLATDLLRQARIHAKDGGLSPELCSALDRMDRERHDWIAGNHETQGAGLRTVRPVPVDPEPEDEFSPAHDWPNLLERLLADRSTTPG